MRYSLLVLISLCSQAYSFDCSLPQKIVWTFEEYHLSPRALDDSMSLRIFDNFIELIDTDKDLISVSDVEFLNKVALDFDNDINNRKCTSFEFITDFVINKMNKIQIHIEQIDQGQIESINKLQLTIPSDNRVIDSFIFYENLIALKFAGLKFSGESESKENLSLFEQAKQSALCNLNRIFDSQDLKQELFNKYLNAITTSYDPHSSYLNKKEKVKFDFELNTEFLGFGLILKRDVANQVVVDKIQFGSPAWNSGKLQEGDIIKSIKGEMAFDLECLSVGELNERLSKSNLNNINIVFDRANHQESICLNRSFITQYDNLIKSVKVTGEYPVAYIQIPSFYSTYTDMSHVKGLADDMAKSLIQLKSEGIKGLIVDLRNNGGGDLAETIKLLGLFVDQGALFQIGDNKNVVNKVPDMNRGVLYNGPMIVIINEASASASEVIASTLQKLNRAVIIGSPSYGKATSQALMKINNTLNNEHFVTITIGSIYDVEGNSHQGGGVIPDIIIKNTYGYLIPKENSDIDYLNLTTVTPISFKGGAILDDNIKQLSNIRLAKNSKYDSLLKVDQNEPRQFILELSTENYRKNLQEINAYLDKLLYGLDLKETQVDFSIPEYLNFDVKLDPVLKEIYQKEIERLKKDMIMQESYFVIEDIIKNKN